MILTSAFQRGSQFTPIAILSLGYFSRAALSKFPPFRSAPLKRRLRLDSGSEFPPQTVLADQPGMRGLQALIIHPGR